MSGREIRTKIASIKNTQKITKAMELVAASKMRKAQQRMSTTRPYADKMRQVIGHVAASHSEYHHPFLTQRQDIKRIGFIVISSDRGLCGSLNVNLFKQTVLAMQEWHAKGIHSDLCLIGSKADAFFRRFGGNILANANHLGDAPNVNDLIGIVKVMLDAYNEQRLDAVYIAYNRFVNSMTQQPVVKQLLPLEVLPVDDKVGYWDYIYEPDAKELLNALLIRYIETQVYQAVVENMACEQAARMVAMKNATDNAGELINELQLIYNKARQASITREIAEITAGAEALS
ncbi:MAG TPA: F0F1 ATP synthase subunit gamma [Gammaproteobacteria bacterium]|nr:F0F1 ATP synthase subunit gamma [Gammaproteobacteria bacterium]